MKTLNATIMVLLLVFLTNAAMASETETSASADSVLGGIKLTPMVGGTFFSIVGSDEEILSDGGNTGSMGGVLAGMNFGFFDLESGLLYLETGASYGNLAASLDTTISYLALPVYAKVPIFQAGEVDFYGRAGVLGAYKMDAKIEGSGFATGYLEDINKNINDFDVLGQLGLGGSYQLQQNILVGGELSFIRGFTEVVKDAGGHNQGVSAAVTLTVSI